MNRSRLYVLQGLLVFVFLYSCQPTGQTSDSRHEFRSFEASVSSRGVDVPVSYVHPIGDGDESFPLFVMALGHGWK